MGQNDDTQTAQPHFLANRWNGPEVDAGYSAYADDEANTAAAPLTADSTAPKLEKATGSAGALNTEDHDAAYNE